MFPVMRNCSCCTGCEECGSSCSNCSGITPAYINATLSGFPTASDCLCQFNSTPISTYSSQAFSDLDGTYEAACNSSASVFGCAGLGSSSCRWVAASTPGNGLVTRYAHNNTNNCTDTTPVETTLGYEIVIQRCDQGACATGQARWRVWVVYWLSVAPWDGYIVFYGEGCSSDCESEVTINNQIVSTPTAPFCASNQNVTQPCACDATTVGLFLIDWEAGSVTLTPCP